MRFDRLLLAIFVILRVSLPVPAEPSSSDGQRGGLDRTAEALELHRLNLSRLGKTLSAGQRNVTQDVGNVAVMQDDGTLIVPFNLFDLTGKSLTFTPQSAGYFLQAGTSVFDAATGASSTTLALTDDDSIAITFPFPFPFYGVTYDAVFVNTDGNLTFGQGDNASTERNLSRILKGPPRISPLFDDLLPSSTGTVTVQKLSDRLIVNWLSISEYGGRTRNTFQAVLHSDGVIQMNYQSMSVTGAVVSLSPGNNIPADLLDLSLQSGASFSRSVAEVFSVSQQLDLAAISEAFLATHHDSYDSLIVFSDFDINLQNAFAYEIPVRNKVEGIMPESGAFDYGSDFGSADRLLSMVNAGSVSQYPTDPQQIFLGSNNTLEILGQEFGHTWLAFIDTNPSSMLGRDRAHWSFFMNTEGSVMEGNQIQDLGGGLFETIGATFRYSPLDQYVMGLRAPSEVPSWFVVGSPSLVSAPSTFTCRPINAACGPAVGVQLQGIRRDITIQDVITIAGPRAPDSATAQKDFSVAFVLITKNGQEANSKSIAHLDDIRNQWESFFGAAVDGRGTMTTVLQPLKPITTSQVDLSLPVNGSTQFETVLGNDLEVGYGSVQSGFGVAVLRSYSNSGLVSEAAVPASTAALKWTFYAEKASGLSTGVAIANPNDAPANLTMTLSNGQQATLQIPNRGQHAAFIDELFPGLKPFLGTLTLQSDVPVAVLALRGSQNVNGDFVMATIPLSSAPPSAGGIEAFSMIADGGSYNTEVILANSGDAMSTGTIRFSFTAMTDAGTASVVPFSIAPGAVWKLKTLGLDTSTMSGGAIISVDAGTPMPEGTAVIRFSSAGGLISETGLPAQSLLTHGLFFGSFNGSLRTGVALLNSSTQSVTVTLTAHDQNGSVVGSPANITLPALERTSAFIDELIPNLPSNFDGTVSLDAPSGVYAISLRGTTLTNGGFLMAATPILDLTQPTPSPTYFPQIASGGSFTTEFLISGVGSGLAQVAFQGQSGLPLSLLLQ